MATIVNFENSFEMPLSLHSLEDFRRWTRADGFPRVGRIDYVDGRIEVEMSPEDLFTHGTPKSEIHGVLYGRVKKQGRGHLFVDRTRIASAPGNLSAEPDLVFVSHQSIASGRVRLIPKSTGQPGRFVELEGGPDLVVEIVSDGSETKDTQRLPNAYFDAGVEEFWLVDVRGHTPLFRIHGRGKSSFEAVEQAADGFQHSHVLECWFELQRRWNDAGFWEYDLRSRD
jgi:Uma2 family endonuclease